MRYYGLNSNISTSELLDLDLDGFFKKENYN